jgi:16S rRNA processing protein RimM
MNNTTEWATIGTIVAPFGLRGEVKVFSLTDVPDRFAKLKYIYVGPSATRYAIQGVRPYKGNLILLKLEGVNKANTAEELRNCDLILPVDELAKLPEDIYYQHDILGLTVLRLDGREVGVIRDIWTTGGNDIYEIRSSTGEQFLIPAVKDIIKQIDLIRHVMYIDPIQGLLDDDAVIVDPDSEEA